MGHHTCLYFTSQSCIDESLHLVFCLFAAGREKALLQTNMFCWSQAHCDFCGGEFHWTGRRSSQ